MSRADYGGCSLDAPAGAVVYQSFKNAGGLGGFQVFDAKTGGKFAGKMRAAAIGTASKILGTSFVIKQLLSASLEILL